MRTLYASALIVLAAGLAAAPTAAQQRPDMASICADCHAGVTAQHREALGHAEGATCLDCHHIGRSNDPEVTRARRGEACVACHDEQEDAHVDASHFGEPGDTPSCTSCHSIHGDPAPREAGTAISTRCAGCHADDGHVLHAALGAAAPVCTDCHVSHSGEAFSPAQPSLGEACAACHASPHPSHAQAGDGFRCTTCHGMNSSGAAGLGAAPAEQCGACHEDVGMSHANVNGHGEPSCLDCHSFSQESATGAGEVSTALRCSTCHDEAMGHFMAGGHAAGMADEPNADLPNCLTCHPAHTDPGQARSQLRLAATVRCMECHGEERLMEEYGLPLVAPSYEDDFHGATARFMYSHPEAGEELPPIMVCSDCHGSHEVGWDEETVVADVCRRCHEESEDYLAGAWLGHGEIGPRNQPVIFLVRLFYMFLIPFMLIGLFLAIVFELLMARREGARMLRTEGVRRLLSRLKGKPKEPEEMVQRFSLTDRWEHMGSAVTFILLVITGLPQTRPDLPAARALIQLMGGIGTTRSIHRVIGVAFVALFISHVAQAVIRSIRRRRLPVMVPVRKDFEDIVQTFRHYLLGEKRPRVGKFDFAEKFEYWGLFLGGIVMSGTGLILLFPELVTQVLPGIVVAATRVMHGLEATFAVSVVILWHSWGVMLRPEVFPLDTTIFSGKMSMSRLKHEHPLEYERLFPDRARAEADDDGAESPAPGLSRREEGLAGA
jgi:predicted CXXCH cytochrome family protein